MPSLMLSSQTSLYRLHSIISQHSSQKSQNSTKENDEAADDAEDVGVAQVEVSCVHVCAPHDVPDEDEHDWSEIKTLFQG